MQNLRVENGVCSFDMKSKDHTANSIRRALLMDVSTIAPTRVDITENTSCQTDEYIAHRIGLVPFLFVVEGREFLSNQDFLTVDVSDRTVRVSDLQGESFVCICPDTPIIKLIKGQRFCAQVSFSEGAGACHSRFSPVAAVGYELNKDTYKFSFESINGENPLVHLRKALQSLKNRLENVKCQVENA